MKPGPKASNQMQRRPVVRPYKTDALKPHQRKALVRWLTVDKVTYAKAQELLKQQFGILLSTTVIFRFWHRHCAPPLVLPPDVLLDVVFKSASPVRLIIHRKGRGIKISQI